MKESVRVAVVGAGGRVGSALVKYLSADARFSVVGHCRNSLIAAPLRLDGLDIRTGSLTARSAAALLGHPNVVINCAVDAGWITTARAANRDLVKTLYEIPDLSKLVLFSSIGVYGNTISRARSAFDRPRPAARYADEKLDMERYAARLRHSRVTTIVMRMGHVYGPYQWLSRALFELLESREQRLPFNGERESNAIFIANVCRAMGSLVSSDTAGGIYNLVDRPQQSWRTLADWHARAIGVGPLAGMTPDESSHWFRRYLRAESAPAALQLGGDMARWAKTLPSSFLGSSTTALKVGPRLLAALGSRRLEARLRAAYATIGARKAIAVADRPMPSWLLSEEVPGSVFEYPSLPPSNEDAMSLAAWYGGYSMPTSLEVPLHAQR